MRTCLMALAVAVPSLVFAQTEPPGKEKKSAPPPYDKVYEVKIADLDEFVVKTDKLLINNFSLSATKVGTVKGMEMLKFFASCRNRSEGYQQYTVMVVGLDEKKGVLWATKMNTGVSEKDLGLLQDFNDNVPQGTLKSTASIWMRVVVSEQAAGE